VAAFNQRAIAVYERAGFQEVRRYDHFTNGALYEFVWMTWDSRATTVKGGANGPAAQA
jgi:RimJ/RimL family protein N-acetyltransferase